MGKEVVQRATHKIFLITILFNALNGLGDLGLALIFIFKNSVLSLLILGIENSGNLGDAIRWSYSNLSNISSYLHALAISYFISHGVIKIFLSLALWKQKLWAYPLAIFFFSVFSLYQVGVLFWHHSALDIVLLIINLAVLILVGSEYKMAKLRMINQDKIL